MSTLLDSHPSIETRETISHRMEGQSHGSDMIASERLSYDSVDHFDRMKIGYDLSPDHHPPEFAEEGEEAAAKAQMAKLQVEAKAIAFEISQCQAILDHFAEVRRRKVEIQAEQKRRRIAEKKLQQKRLEEERERAMIEKRLARGTKIDFVLCEASYVTKRFDEKVTCIACGGDSTLMIYENGGFAFTSGLPRALFKLLEGRKEPLPDPEYAALGSRERYYIRFCNGKSEWVGCDEMSSELETTSRRVRTIAFGRDWNSYFIVYSDGGWSYKNVPSGLVEFIKSRQDRSTGLECVSLGPAGEYFLRSKDGRACWGGMAHETLASIYKVEDRVKFIDFGDKDAYLCRYR